MKKYTVNSPVNHDGKDYRAGEIELADEHAAPLLQANVISELTAAAENPNQEGGQTEDTEEANVEAAIPENIATTTEDIEEANVEATIPENIATATEDESKTKDNVTPLRGAKGKEKK